ncbi:MAG: hypothetical protein EOP49_32240 [Sphingobacteriales bacterium]|nr:MAG: hypothetical protein EOP49_32240 [Sphingobacteriales bacterium]
MSFERGNRQKKSFDNVRGIMGMSMGVIYCIIAAALVYMKSKGELADLDRILVYALAGLMGAYGLFRIYRGFKMSKGEGL